MSPSVPACRRTASLPRCSSGCDNPAPRRRRPATRPTPVERDYDVQSHAWGLQNEVEHHAGARRAVAATAAAATFARTFSRGDPHRQLATLRRRTGPRLRSLNLTESTSRYIFGGVVTAIRSPQRRRLRLVMANPPFNADRVDKDKFGGDSPFPFGLHQARQHQLLVGSSCSPRRCLRRPGSVRHGQLPGRRRVLRTRIRGGSSRLRPCKPTMAVSFNRMRWRPASSRTDSVVSTVFPVPDHHPVSDVFRTLSPEDVPNF